MASALSLGTGITQPTQEIAEPFKVQTYHLLSCLSSPEHLDVLSGAAPPPRLLRSSTYLGSGQVGYRAASPPSPRGFSPGLSLPWRIPAELEKESRAQAPSSSLGLPSSSSMGKKKFLACHLWAGKPGAATCPSWAPFPGPIYPHPTSWLPRISQPNRRTASLLTTVPTGFEARHW